MSNAVDNGPVIITGGSGFLGHETATLLAKHSVPYTSTSRTNPFHDRQWRYLDLENGAHFDDALRGNRTVLHLASGTRLRNRNTDVEGTKKLLSSAHRVGIRHFIYISIVGIDNVPMKYYQYKLEAERCIASSGIPYTILRATQFHGFVDFMLGRWLKYPFSFLPSIQVQPIDIAVVARRLFSLTMDKPHNATLNLGGKEIFSSRALAAIWLRGRSQHRMIVDLPLVGKLGTSLRTGALTCPERTSEGLTWGEWVDRQYGTKQ
ncbi:MAG: NAD(P)H-binding protein [Ignavibacteriales bacterium]|nr:NAD(P)H-binding protein [Ignavibacteriales bacterium]